jgi:hypothetical protein
MRSEVILANVSRIAAPDGVTWRADVTEKECWTKITPVNTRNLSLEAAWSLRPAIDTFFSKYLIKGKEQIEIHTQHSLFAGRFTSLLL